MRHPVRTGAYVFLFIALATGIPGFVVFRMIMSSRSYVLEASAEELEHATVTPHLEHPIEPGRNAIYCSTFQLAWNEACACLGEDIHLENEPPMVGVLNKKKATRDDLDDASFIALAGRVHDGIIPRIKKSQEDLVIFKALQNIRFRLDEKGAELKSEAILRGGCAGGPESKRIMVFDRPFLLMLRMKGRPTPYFAMWVGHPEILVPKR